MPEQAVTKSFLIVGWQWVIATFMISIVQALVAR